MGYYTNFEIRVLDCELPIKNLVSLFKIHCDECFDADGKDDIIHVYGSKWYEHEKELSNVSKHELPTFIIEVMGYGEENGDVWRKFFFNGKVQRCETVIAFDPYDPEKLDDVRNYEY